MGDASPIRHLASGQMPTLYCISIIKSNEQKDCSFPKSKLSRLSRLYQSNPLVLYKTVNVLFDQKKYFLLIKNDTEVYLTVLTKDFNLKYWNIKSPLSNPGKTNK